MTKTETYAALVLNRKECRACAGLRNPAEFPGDADQIGPWTRWQGNLSAPLMVVGQDWGDITYFTRYAGRESPNNPTNEKLRQLLTSVGVAVDGPLRLDQGQICYFTNAILCLKAGGLQGTVRREWFVNCLGFLRRQVELVAPKVIVALGERAFRSVLNTYEMKAGAFKDEVVAPGRRLPNGSFLVPVYHCGARILNTHRKWEQQRSDWRRVQIALSGDGLEERYGPTR